MNSISCRRLTEEHPSLRTTIILLLAHALPTSVHQHPHHSTIPLVAIYRMAATVALYARPVDRPRTAVRRGAACAAAAHSNTVRGTSGVAVPRMSGCPLCLVRPVRLRQRPHVQRPPVPVSGVRHVSSVRASGVRASSVRCPVSDVRCPVSGASVRHPCPLSPHR